MSATSERLLSQYRLSDAMRYVVERGIEDPPFWSRYWLGIDPHPGQRPWIGKRARRSYKADGRQSGKTTSEAIAAGYDIFHGPEGFGAANLGPVIEQAGFVVHKLYEYASQAALGALIENYKQSPFPTIMFAGARSITARSLQNKGKFVRGHTWHRANVDEMPYCTQEDIAGAVEPTLIATKGRFSGMGTPKGKNFFYNRYRRAESLYDRERSVLEAAGFAPDEAIRFARHFATKAPSISSPYISREDIEEARANMPDELFRQEYMAEFVDSGDHLFTWDQVATVTNRDLNPHQDEDGNWLGVELQPIEGGRYVWAWDLGRKQSWVSGILMNYATLPYTVVKLERWHHKPWDAVVAEIAALKKRWGAQVVIDSTGVGDVVLPWLSEKQARVEGYLFNPRSKTELLLTLQRAVQQTEFITPFYRSLYDQMLAYTWSEKSDLDSTWDDIMSISLAVWYSHKLNRRAPVPMATL